MADLFYELVKVLNVEVIKSYVPMITEWPITTLLICVASFLPLLLYRRWGSISSMYNKCSTLKLNLLMFFLAVGILIPVVVSAWYQSGTVKNVTSTTQNYKPLPATPNDLDQPHCPNTALQYFGPCMRSSPAEVPATSNSAPTEESLSRTHAVEPLPSCSRLSQGPTMPELTSFEISPGKTINIATQIGDKHKDFGLKLLDDKSGKLVENIAYYNEPEAREVNTNILKRWRDGAGRQPVTWETVIKTLDEIGLSDLAARIRSSVDIHSRPSMPDFVTLTLSDRENINIPTEIGVLSEKFSVVLLNDPRGAATKVLTHGSKRAPEDISRHLMMVWLQRTAASWATLVDTLISIGLRELGKDIGVSLCKQ